MERNTMSTPQSTGTMQLVIDNPSNSGADNDQIYVCITGYQPAPPGTAPSAVSFGYIDLSTPTPAIVATGTAGFSYQSGVYSQTLSQLLTTFPNGIPIPAIESARIYFAIFEDFTASTMAASGPAPGYGTPNMFDTVEFDTSNPGTYNINPTNVDFYGISYTVSATDSSGTTVTTGFNQPRSTILNALYVPPVGDDRKFGNTNIFNYCAITTAQNTLRVLSPKSPAPSDWDPGSPTTAVARATQCSHFFDEYVRKHCFKPSRKFTFYNKLWSQGMIDPAQLQVWGEVSSDGLAMNLYSTADRSGTPTQTLSPPVAPWPLPDFAANPTEYHSTSGTSADQIDWGFLLAGNAATNTGVANSDWSTDAATAIMVSICRGVMHLDDGTTSWVDATRYYQGDGGVSTVEMPIFYYASILHQYGLTGLAYALSLDDVYGTNPSIAFNAGATVTVTLVSMEQAVQQSSAPASDGADAAPLVEAGTGVLTPA
jgi:hypothetical protein